MAYLEAIDGALRRRLIANPIINSLVAARVYHSYLADISNPSYPCICFSRVSSSRDHRYNKRVACEYTMWIYSSSSFKETDQIYEEIKNSLDNEYFDLPDSLGKVGFRIVENPIQDIEPDHQLYTSIFTMQSFAFFT